MKTPEETLKEFNITTETKHHSYKYLYNSFIKILTQCQQDNAETTINFAEWLSDSGWIKDPFPQKGFSDDKLRYTNIANIDVHSDDKLLAYTIQELYEQFLTTLNKQ